MTEEAKNIPSIISSLYICNFVFLCFPFFRNCHFNFLSVFHLKNLPFLFFKKNNESVRDNISNELSSLFKETQRTGVSERITLEFLYM